MRREDTTKFCGNPKEPSIFSVGTEVPGARVFTSVAREEQTENSTRQRSIERVPVFIIGIDWQKGLATASWVHRSS
jgi:hypothetical protein